MLVKILCLFLMSFQIFAQDNAETTTTPETSSPPIQLENKVDDGHKEIEKEDNKENSSEDENRPRAIAKIIRGDVYFIAKAMDGEETKELKLEQGSEIEAGYTITTKDKSFAQISLPDETILNIGPNSQMMIEQLDVTTASRKVSLLHINGQIRSLINRKSVEGDSWKLNTKAVSVGVRGTEFLSNAYLVGAKDTTDVALLKGEVLADVSKTGSSFKDITLKPGQFFNSSEIASKGIDGIKTLSKEVLESLQQNAENFLPKLQDLNGDLIDLDKSLRSNLGLPPLAAATGLLGAVATAPLLTGGSDDDEKEEEKPVLAPVKKEENTKSRVVIKGGKHKELKDQPWDIRDAMINASDKRVDNTCFFWFYKSIPGSGDLERFRRERNCEDYEY